MDEMLGGTSTKGSGKSTGLSQASMTAMISADTSMKQAKVQGNVASRFEGRAGVLEIEIKLDESRAVNGLSANTEGKKAELAEVEQKAMNVTAAQMETLGEVNKSMEEANKADEQTDNKDTNAASSKEKNEENVSGADVQEKAVLGADNGAQPGGVDANGNETDKDMDISAAEPALAEQQTVGYTHVDVRL